jgi:hypothetical protein
MDRTTFKNFRFFPLFWFTGILVGFYFPQRVLLSAAAKLPLHCPLRWFTGYLCPTCGLGRSLISAWTGAFQESWSFHPAGLLIFSFFLARSLGIGIRFSPSRRWLRASVFIYILWGFARNLTS